MKIENDQVEFENTDIDQLSPKLQVALQVYAGERLTPAEFLSKRTNDDLANALTVSVANQLDELKEELIAAPIEKQIEANALLDQAKLVLQALPK